MAFHGVFTECLMCIGLVRCLEHRVFTGRARHELRGRLSFALKRLSLDLMNLRHEGLFAPEGESLYREFGRIFDEIYRLTREEVVACDLSNQPFTFSYPDFAALNPPA